VSGGMMTNGPSPRELFNTWLRVLTITGESGKTPQQKMKLVAQVNDPEKIHIQLETPLSVRDRHELDAAIDAVRSRQSRQAGVHLVIESYQMSWLGDGTGQTPSEIIQRLALAVEADLPPETQ